MIPLRNSGSGISQVGKNGYRTEKIHPRKGDAVML